MTPQPDGAILHFLKEVPAWVVIGIFVAAFLAVWQASHDDFIPRIIDGLVGALLTSIVGQVRKPAPTINTDTVNTETIDTTAVNAENLNVDNKEK